MKETDFKIFYNNHCNFTYGDSDGTRRRNTATSHDNEASAIDG